MEEKSGWSMIFSSLYPDTIQEIKFCSPLHRELFLFLNVLWVIKSQGYDYYPFFFLKGRVGRWLKEAT